MAGFSSSPDLKQSVLAHMAAAKQGIEAAQADATVPKSVSESLVHLHDAVVALAKIQGVGFF